MASNVVARRILVLALCLGALTASDALEDRKLNRAADSCSQGAVSRLYLGQTTPTGVVSGTDWRAFVAESVTPRFPAGFTELQAQGRWRDDRGVTTEEDTRIIEIVHDGELRSRVRVREIAAAYKHRFAQQSVLITQAQSFHCF